MITAVNFGEVLYKLAQAGRSAMQTEQIFLALGFAIDEASLPDVRLFPDLKRVDALSRAAQTKAKVASDQIKTLALADMTCLGYALHRGLPVLTGDRHWTTLGEFGLTVAVYDFRDTALTL